MIQSFVCPNPSPQYMSARAGEGSYVCVYAIQSFQTLFILHPLAPITIFATSDSLHSCNTMTTNITPIPSSLASLPRQPPAPAIPTNQQHQQQPNTTSTTHGSTPSDFLSAVLGRPVTVYLNNGSEYRGVLVCLDGYMNIGLEQTEQFENGQLKQSFGDAFIRGNNVFYIATSTTTTPSTHINKQSANV